MKITFLGGGNMANALIGGLVNKGFAAGVSREVILNGCEMLGLPLEDVIQKSILGMRDVHESLGM